MSGYIGSTPVPQATQHRESFTCTEGQTTFNTAGYTAQFVDVYLNGSHLSPADFTATNGSDVVLGVAASADDVCDIISYTPFEVADATFTGDFKVDGTTFNVDSSNNRIGVGTASPASDLHLVSSTSGDPEIRIEGSGTANGIITFLGSGHTNPAVGLRYISSGDSVGHLAFFANGTSSSTLSERFRISADGSLSTPTAGTSNVRFGVNAGNSILDGGNYNVCVGDEAGTALTTGDANVAIGYQALIANTEASYITGVGYQALKLNTSGTGNVALGADALRQNLTGAANVAVGNNALVLNTGSNNTAVGKDAGTAVTSGTGNSYIGANAGDGSDEGANNVALGYLALSADHGNNNVAVGEGAMIAGTGGTNTVVGSAAGGNASFSGSGNTFIGRSAGTAITSGSNNIFIGNAVGPTSASQSNGIALGVSIAAAANDFSFGKSGNVVTCDFDADATFERSSDLRLKTNVADAILGLDFINDLRPVTYKWKSSGDLDANDAELAHLRTEDEDGNIINQMTTDVTMHGLIAQEVKTALDTANVSTFKGWDKDNFGVQTISREMYVIPLIKAVQELSTALDAALARITALEG
jgi:hypothetical protein